MRKKQPEPEGRAPAPSVLMSQYVLHPDNSRLVIGKISPLSRNRYRGVFFAEPVLASRLAQEEPRFRPADTIIRPTRRAVRWAMTHIFNTRLTSLQA